MKKLHLNLFTAPKALHTWDFKDELFKLYSNTQPSVCFTNAQQVARFVHGLLPRTPGKQYTVCLFTDADNRLQGMLPFVRNSTDFCFIDLPHIIGAASKSRYQKTMIIRTQASTGPYVPPRAEDAYVMQMALLMEQTGAPLADYMVLPKNPDHFYSYYQNGILPLPTDKTLQALQSTDSFLN